MITIAKVELRAGIALLRRLAVPLRRLFLVPSNTFTVRIADAEVVLRGSIPLRRRLAIYVIVELISLPLALGLLHGRLDMSLSPLLASLIMLALNWLMLVGQKAAPTLPEN